MSFKAGSYHIRTPGKLIPIGTGSRDGNSGPYPIVPIPNIIDISSTKFTFEKAGDNEYIIKCHGYNVVAINGKLFADPAKPTTQNTWKVRELKDTNGIGMVYVITDSKKDLDLGWKIPEDGQVPVGPVAETRSMPPQYIDAEWKVDSVLV